MLPLPEMPIITLKPRFNNSEGTNSFVLYTWVFLIATDF
jgi:hypothetical protein